MTPQQSQNTENEYKHYTLYIYIMSKRIFWAIFFAVLMLTSCSSRKDFAYLQDMKIGQAYDYDARYEATVHVNDRLSIKVTCKKPELAIPFNMHGRSVSVDPSGNVSTSSSNSEDSKGYRVDVDGNIDFPILGKLHVQGLKVSEVTNGIRDLIIKGNYIKDPQVSLEFLNFKYTVLGAVGSAGTYTVDDDRITLLDAIAKAGDLRANAKMDHIAVIREVDGKRQVYIHDIRSKNIFTSPCYYLQQNDIVYVEPKYQSKDKEDRFFQIGGFITGLAGIAATIVAICVR